MFRRFGKRVTILATLGLLVLAASAVAYFTATASGTGSGQASVGTQPAAAKQLVLHANITGSLMPDGNASPISFTVDNPNDGAVKLRGLQLDNPALTVDAAHSDCQVNLNPAYGNLGWFVLSLSGNTGLNQEIAGGASGMTINGASGSIKMPARDDINQDACQGATLTVHVTSN